MKDYVVTLRCPHRDGDVRITLRRREESLEQMLNTAWDFECPVHGVQHEIPLEVQELTASPGSLNQTVGWMAGPQARRRSRRLPLHIPVSVYAKDRKSGAFREEASSVLVNAHGGLITLSARVVYGETLHVVNKATREEQECRVAYVGRGEGAGYNVGVAFKGTAPRFWGVDFPAQS